MRIIAALICVCTLLGCSSTAGDYEPIDTQGYIKGVWLSYSEINGMLKSDFKEDFKKAVQRCKTIGITDMFVHIRAFCDAIYPSKHFPLWKNAEQESYDVLEFMIDCCHASKIKFHAWINPYRVSHSETLEGLPSSSPVKELSKGDYEIFGGIYLNPASSKARRLIIDGVREVVENYSVDGIHFDDYFYPTTLEDFDKNEYNEYKSASENPISLGDWRRANVNAMISGCYTAIKFADKDIVFSISPAASINNNYDTLFADISTWIECETVDYIIPQLYFGFEYPDESFGFERLLSDWKQLTQNGKARLLIGLAAYKLGTTEPPDSSEWGNGADILSRQARICLDDQAVSGHIFFSYSALFSEKAINQEALRLLKQ